MGPGPVDGLEKKDPDFPQIIELKDNKKLFNYLLSIHYVSGTPLDSGDIVVKKNR